MAATAIRSLAGLLLAVGLALTGAAAAAQTWDLPVRAESERWSETLGDAGLANVPEDARVYRSTSVGPYGHGGVEVLRLADGRVFGRSFGTESSKPVAMLPGDLDVFETMLAQLNYAAQPEHGGCGCLDDCEEQFLESHIDGQYMLTHLCGMGPGPTLFNAVWELDQIVGARRKGLFVPGAWWTAADTPRPPATWRTQMPDLGIPALYAPKDGRSYRLYRYPAGDPRDYARVGRRPSRSPSTVEVRIPSARATLSANSPDRTGWSSIPRLPAESIRPR